MEIFMTMGINWAHFVELTVNEEDSTIHIHNKYRLHRFNDEWPQKCKDAPQHPARFSTEEIREDSKRTVTHYNHPTWGWLPVSNPRHIFSYNGDMS